MALLAGVDGCPGGWLCVTLDTEAGFRDATIYASADQLLAAQPTPEVVAVDMPIGLPFAGQRLCDCRARQRLGKRWMCVFDVPTRRALLAPSRIAAASILGRGVNCFEWELYSKIKNLDHYLKPEDQTRVFEVHPEVSVALLNGNVPLTTKKKSPGGMRAREKLLGSVFSELRLRVRNSLEKSGFSHKHFARDDVNDALVALWSARRIANNEAVAFPENIERDQRGLRMAIWA